MKENKKDLSKVTGGFGTAPDLPTKSTGTMKVIDKIKGKKEKLDIPRAHSPLRISTPIPADEEIDDK